MRSMEIMKNYSHKVWKNEKFSLTEEKNSSNQLFSNFFSKTRKTITFTKFLRKKCGREFLQFPHHSVEITGIPSHAFLEKDFVKVTV